MIDWDNIGWGDSIRDYQDKKPHPPQGGSGVPEVNEKNINLNFNLGFGGISFETSTKFIDKIIEKYGDKCTLYISAEIDTKKELTQ